MRFNSCTAGVRFGEGPRRTGPAGVHVVQRPIQLPVLVRLGLQLAQDSRPDPSLLPAADTPWPAAPAGAGPGPRGASGRMERACEAVARKCPFGAARPRRLGRRVPMETR